MANSNYFIAPGAVTITPNIKPGDSHYVGISVVGGAAIRVRNKLTKSDGTVVNVGYTPSLDYRRWALTGGNTNVMSDYNKALNVYARLDAAASGTSGIIMLSPIDHDVYESVTTDSVTTEYYYIKLGTLSAPDYETNLRTLTDWDTGELDTNQGRDNSSTGNFDRAFSIAGNGQSVTPLLPFNGLTILAGYAFTLFGVAINAVKTTTSFVTTTAEQATKAFNSWASATAIATTESIKAFVDAKLELLKNIFIRKDTDDATTHTLTIRAVKTDTISAENYDKKSTTTFTDNVSIEEDLVVEGSATISNTLLVSSIQKNENNIAYIPVADSMKFADGKCIMLTGNNSYIGSASFSSDIMTGYGWRIDGSGKAVFDSVTIRKFLEVPELRYNRIEVTQGISWRAPAAGIINNVVTYATAATVRHVVTPLAQVQTAPDDIGDELVIYHNQVYNLSEAVERGFDDEYGFGTLYLHSGDSLHIVCENSCNIQLLLSQKQELVSGDELTAIANATAGEYTFSISQDGYYAWSLSGKQQKCNVEVYRENSANGYFDLKLEDGEIGSFSFDDICQGIFHNENAQLNAATDDESSFRFAGFCTVYFRVVKVEDYTVTTGEGNAAVSKTYTNGRVYYSLRSGYTVPPQPAMAIVGYGNFTNADRQTSAYSTRTYERKLVGVNDYDITQSNIAMHIGDMDGLLEDYRGYSAYLNNIYFSGVIRQLDTQGNEIAVLNYRDDYSPSAIYNLHDEVLYNGELWVWSSATAGSNVTPSAAAQQWKKVGGKGDSGDSGKGINAQTDYYCLSDSASALVNSSAWQTALPAYTVGRYIWRKTVTTYSDNTSVETAPICVQGLSGAAVRPRGTWNSSESYVNNATWIDVVFYNGSTYKAKTASTNQAPVVGGNLNANYWEQFNDFQNVATSVLLAANGYIDVLGSGSIFVGQSNSGAGWYLTEGKIQWRSSSAADAATGVTLKSDGTLECGSQGKLVLAADQLVCTDKAGNNTAWLDELGNFVTAGVQSQLIQSVDSVSRFKDIFILSPDASEFYGSYGEYADYPSVSAAQSADNSLNVYDAEFVYNKGTSAQGTGASVQGVAVAPMCTDGSASDVTSVGYGNRTVSVAASLDMRSAQGIIDIVALPDIIDSTKMFGIILPWLKATYNTDEGKYEYNFLRTPTRMNGEGLHYITLQEIKQLVGRQMIIVNSTSDAFVVCLDGTSSASSSAVVLYPQDSYVFEFILDNTETESVSVKLANGAVFTHDVALPHYKWVVRQQDPSAAIQSSALTAAVFGPQDI